MITLEVTNTLDTNIIDESDGLSLGEAIQIANNDPENSYLIEIPSGSYNLTLTEDFDLVGKITLGSTGDGNILVNFIRAGERFSQWDSNGRNSVSLDFFLGKSNNNNDFSSRFSIADIPDIDIPDIDIPDIDIPDIDIPDIDIPDIDISDINLASFSTDNPITLEITNTQDTNIIDESDGLSLGEAIQIANNDPENDYIFEVKRGSTYNVTLTEDDSIIAADLIASGTDDNLTTINIIESSGELRSQFQFSGSSQSLLSLPNINPDTDTLRLTGGTAQIAYVAYYGRPADPGGFEFWNNILTENDVSYSPRNGDTLTGASQEVYDQIVNDFGRSDEADRLFGDIESNRDRVNRVYQFCFDRDAEEGGLDFWTDQLDQGNITLANFALEVALGAQNEDVEVLNNKIESAGLFSESIDTEAETNAYVGSSAEVFGRDWLAGFSDTVSSIEEVDSALTDLVDGNG